LISVDGQLIVDVPSTLNAKHWYTPDWKKLPLQGPSRDLELDYGSLKKLRVMAASARGTKHQFYGNENQDAFNVGFTKSGSHLVVVVADGVSSAQFSAYGSRAMSFLVSQSVMCQIDSSSEGDALDMKSIIETAVRQASDRTQNWRVDELYGPQSPPNENSLNDVAATLSVAVVGTTQDKLGSRSVTLACIGDSPCYTLKGAKWTLRSTATKDGVLLEQGTRALPVRLGEDPRLEWFEFDLSDSEVLVLMTDGIGTSLDNGNTAVGRWLAPRLYGPVPLEHFIGTLTYDRQGEDDDRTLAIVYDFQGIVSAIAETQKSVPEVEL
jgi:serine/threonine protein phosphatase PrpC